MLNCPDLDPAIANAAYMEFRASAGWLFDETSEEMFARGRYALAAIEDLRPATALEARMAAQAIASDAHAVDCLRLAAQHRDDLVKVTRCRAQANAMTRQMDRALRTLTTLRKERGAREAVRPLFGPAWAGLAMPREPVPERTSTDPVPEPASWADPLPERPSAADQASQPGSGTDPLPERACAADPVPEPASGANNPVSPAALAKAEQFASRNRLLASRIRAAGGLTGKAIAGFRPSSLPDAATVEALVYGAGPVLAKLDRGNSAAA
jgi:hypothetical protein